jgi:hypothetical protein
MDSRAKTEITHLCRQCRWSAVAAVLIIAIGMAVAIPPALRRRRALHAAHDELLSLQAAIIDTQSQIRDFQAAIVSTQAQIHKAQDAH